MRRRRRLTSGVTINAWVWAIFSYMIVNDLVAKYRIRIDNRKVFCKLVVLRSPHFLSEPWQGLKKK
jgi:hypothetical protein